ncbi:MAG: amidohydrolase [Chloroflexi bacterium]|nr:amidohydrolase [Chloroflexota bacterium]
MTVTDGQLHIWEADRPDRPWNRQHRPQLPEPFTVERVIGIMDDNGVDRAVLVPPLVSGFNSSTANAYALEAATAHPNRLCVMGRFDPRPSDAPDRLARWLEQPGMRGVRLSLEGPPAPQLLEEGALDWFWPAAEHLGVPVFVVRPGGVPELAAIAERHPALQVSCDHLMLPDARSPEGLAAHVETLKALVPHQNVVLKFSSLPLASYTGYPFADLHEPLQRIFDLFGAARMVWATDYTAARGRLGAGFTYAQARDFVDIALPNLTSAERADIFNGTISRFLRWPA